MPHPLLLEPEESPRPGFLHLKAGLGMGWEYYSQFPHCSALPFVRDSDSAHWLGPALGRTKICLGSAQHSYSAVSKKTSVPVLREGYVLGWSSIPSRKVIPG